MDDSSILETIQDSFSNIADRIVDYAPNVLAALLLLLVGIVVAGFVSKLLGKLFNLVESNKNVVQAAKKLNVNVINVSDFVALITKWSIILVFVNAAIDALNIDALSDTFSKILDFLPNLFAAAVIAALSIVVSNVVRDIVKESSKQAGVKAHSFLSTAARIVVLVFGLPLAAAQLNLDLTIVNNNITVVVAGVMLALGLAFGLGGRDTAGKIVEDFYKNWKK